MVVFQCQSCRTWGILGYTVDIYKLDLYLVLKEDCNSKEEMKFQ
jgi:hypothetical protein